MSTVLTLPKTPGFFYMISIVIDFACYLHDKIQQQASENRVGCRLRIFDRILRTAMRPWTSVSGGAWWGNVSLMHVSNLHQIIVGKMPSG